MLFAAAMWGIIWYPMRLLEAAGLPVVWTTLLIYSVAALISFPTVLRQSVVWRELPVDLLWLALAAGLTNLAFLVALIEGQVMRVMLLFYLAPLWSVLLGRWWLGEQLSGAAMLMLCVAMLGTLIMLWQPKVGWPWPTDLADWLALFAGFMFAVNNVLSRKLAAVAMPVKTVIVYFGVVLVAAITLFSGISTIPSASAVVWSVAAVIGGLAIVAMTITVLFGLARLPVYQAAVIMLFELVVAALSAAWLSDEVMRLAEWAGGMLIVVAAYGVARLEKQPSA
ncbi:putative permease [Methylophaga frappieri]|uniref:Putative permease n=1 Tax=Methylophaga frappieri (strain ATCC BAA-2434 / DSM 25690 / JAM7) TaxID=754477 RepID=I1YG14_METFJ|nr:putative permease [Methylophaga frappieri]